MGFIFWWWWEGPLINNPMYLCKTTGKKALIVTSFVLSPLLSIFYFNQYTLVVI